MPTLSHMTARRLMSRVARHWGALWCLGISGAFAGLSGCSTETSGAPSTSCLESQFFAVHWGVDNGLDSIPMSCARLSEMGLSVVLTTNVSDPHVLPVDQYTSCAERAGRICGDGTACNSEGYTASGVPVGTAVVSGSLCGPSGAAIYTVAWPSGPDPLPPPETIPSCGSVAVTFPFRPYPDLPQPSSP